jgi:FAD/FMN-containing dehydrogenase
MTVATDELRRGVVRATPLGSLGRRFHGELILPGDAAYDAARSVWNGLIDRRPALIARCAGVSDVVAAIRFARESDLVVAVRGGGHNVAGTGVVDGGIVVDLSNMRGIRADPARRRVRAEGGATWADVDRETQLFAMAVPGGIVSDTGIAGLTLNGGLGWLRRKYGMTIDSLTSADVVTADGRLLVASERENADLFWAIRGGGGNFGVVTSFEYSMHPVGPDVAFAVVLYPLEQFETVMAAWRDFVRHAPDEVSADVIAWTIPAAPQFPDELHGRAIVGVSALYGGPVEAGLRVLQPLREFGAPLLDLTSITPYLTVQRLFDPFFPKGAQRCYWKSLYLNGLDGGVAREIRSWIARMPSNRTLISIRHLGGEIARVPGDATAFGDRRAPFLLSIDSTWLDAHDDHANIAWTRAFWEAMQRFSSGKIYFNFPGLLEDSDALVRSSYGTNYERLSILKTKYDPDNVFRINQNIEPI